MKAQTVILLTVTLGVSSVLGALLLVRSGEIVALDSQCPRLVVTTAAEPVAQELQRPEPFGIDATDPPPPSRIPITRPFRGQGVTPFPSAQGNPQVLPTTADLLILPETTLDEMMRKRDALDQGVKQRSRPLLSRKFADHLAVFVCGDMSYTTTASDSLELYEVRMVPGEGTFRAALSRAENPELYFMRDEVARLDKSIRDFGTWGDM